MKMPKYGFVTFVLLLIANVLSAQEWVLNKEKNGITVYTRESPSSPIKEFRAVTTMNVGVEKLAEVLQDFENYALWYDRCEKTRLISGDAGGAYVYYTEVSLPFPFSHRDVVSSMTLTKKPYGILLKIEEMEGVVPEKEGIVRMSVAKGHWKLTRLSENKTKLEHQFRGDPAGNIPGGIANMFLVAGPINTLTKLKGYLEARN